MPSQSSIYVVFRGSTSVEDWLGNLEVVLTDYDKCDDCEVHRGFYEAQQSVNAIVIQCVKDLRVDYPNSTVVVTGHSLGKYAENTSRCKPPYKEPFSCFIERRWSHGYPHGD